MQTLPKSDPRYYQIAVLTMLVAAGVFMLDFGIPWAHALVILIAAQTTQYSAGRLAGVQAFDPLSAMVTTLSLTLLLRTDLPGVAALAAIAAIGSKFILRYNGKHIFNPANFAIVGFMLFTDHAWISTGQWGSATIAAFALACLGFLVLTRARRAETTLSFLGAYAALLIGRALWLGDPLSIPLHHLQNGALLIFAFFMISDPKTTPNTAVGRCLYGSLVALIAHTIQFVYYQPYGPMLALFFAAPIVPLIDAALHGQHYRWLEATTRPLTETCSEGVKQCE